MSIATRIKSAEAHLPKQPDSDAEKLIRRLMNASECAFFSGIFGDYSDYLAAASCADREGALAVAERVNGQTDGVAGIAFIGLDLAPLTEGQVIRLQSLFQATHPLDETSIAEIRAIVCSALPTEYGFPRGQSYCN